jgi:two-component system sensor histidine kinase BaeS
MRSRLFWKLFGLQLLAAAVLLGSALLVVRAYTAYNFSMYMESVERTRLHELAERIAQRYVVSHDLAQAADSLRPQGPLPEQAIDAPDDRAPPRPGQRPRHRPPPLTVRDTGGIVVSGNTHPEPPQGSIEVPIEANGHRIGTLSQPRVQGPPPFDQQRFAAQQLRSLAVIGACAMGLAALFASLITAFILRPIRRLSDGVAALARREFSTRLDPLGDDELSRLATDFNRLAAALARYDERQRQWLADIAHELRTPLATLRAELEARLDGVRPIDAAALRSHHQETLRLGRLVDDLHLLSLAESGGLVLHTAPTPLVPLLESCVERYRERFHAQGFRLLTDIGHDAPVLTLDIQRFEQVLANLLDNILRHAEPPGPVTLALRTSQWECCISLSDGGPGVPDAALPRLFDRLFRTDAARSRSNGGSGLGLAICRSIIVAHGGHIAARRDGRGLTFDIRLPRDTP